MRWILLDDPFSTDRLNGVADFRPDWDVATLGKGFTDGFSAAVDDIRSRPASDPARKVHAFLGPAGYGKTHLFGRIHHQQGDGVFFAFIPALGGLADGDKKGQLETALRWRVVESLLNSPHTFAPLRVQFARLLAPSFAAYFDRLGGTFKAKFAGVRDDLQRDPLTVLELLSRVNDLAPYHQLADGMRTQFPTLSGSVVRALVLAVSPAADDARWWLRGEADQLPDGRLAALKLPDESPSLIDVLQAVAEILRRNGVVLVVCFDQLEELFKNDRAGFTALTAQVMSWLQTVPNLMLGIGCLEDVWKELAQGGAGFASFRDRVTPHRLSSLTGDEAVEMLERRMKTWSEHDPKLPKGWPFDLDSVRRFAEKNQPSPRGFIQSVCSPKFNDWLATKRPGLIRLDAATTVPPLGELFKQEWAKELEAVTAARTTATDTQDAELWAIVEEGLAVACLGNYWPAGVCVDAVHKQPLKASQADPRFSVRLDLTANGRSGSVVVAVNKKDGGTAFGHWITALETAWAGPVVGAVVVWPRAQLSVSKASAGYKKYEERRSAGTIRPFNLDEQEATFRQLLCLGRMTTAAKTGNLILGSTAVGHDDCRKLTVETGLLANLKLFEFVFQTWPAWADPPAVTAGPAVPPPPTTEPKPPAGVTPAAPPAANVGPHLPPPTPPPPAAEPAWADVMLKRAADFLRKKGQNVQPVGVDVGPTFVRLRVEVRGDADFSKIKRQEKNLMLNLQLQSEPLVAAQAGYVSIDLQRPDPQTVLLPPLLATCPGKLAGEPAFPAGVGVSGNVEWLNLSEPESCHLLVAGTTGSGKSEFLKALLAALAARLTPAEVRFRLVDPKRVTFNVDPRCPYLGGPVVYDGEEAIPVLEQCSDEMERRYGLLQRRGLDHVRHLAGADVVPRWVVVLDEFADLMTDKATKRQLEPLLNRLGAKARAAGIHLVLGTQRPEASVVTPILRSNLPGRIGLKVATEKESKLFLDDADAAYLFGKGDLVWKRGGGLVRLQSPFVPKAEFDRHLRVGP